MARTVLPIAGAVVGFWIGGPAGAQWGYAAGSLVAAAIPQQAQGPRIGETGAQTSQEGAPRAIVYGTCQVTGNVIASGPLIKRDVEENQGGKGGADVSTEHAYRTFAVRICEGPIGAILRVWQDDKLVYDIRPDSTMVGESDKWLSNVVFYSGSEEQLPDPTLQMIFGVGEVPAHRGSAYMVKIEDDLTDRRGSIPQFRFEVAKAGLQPWDFSWTINEIPTSIFPVAVEADGSSQMYASATTNEILESIDGVTWALISGTSPSGNVIMYSPTQDKWVAPCGNIGSPKIHTKSGSAPWQTFTPSGAYPPQQTWRDGCWAGDRYLIVGNDVLGIGAVGRATSFDGLTWTMGPTGEGWWSIAYSPSLDKVVAVGGTLASMSADKGITFTNYTVSGAAMRSVIWVEELAIFVAVGGSVTAWSSDGSTWTLGTWDGPATINMTTLAWSPDRGIMVSPGGDTTPYFSSSTDGKVWKRQSAGVNFAASGGTVGPSQVVWNEGIGKFVYPINDSSYVTNTGAAYGLPEQLSSIVSDIHARCNFPVTKFDVSELDDMVSGLVLAGEYTGADAINTLRSLYLFDAADQDKIIVYPKRGKAVVATITEDDIVEAEESSKREQAIEYPKKLHLSYQNAVGGYAVAKATSARSSPDVRVVGEVSTSVPVVLSPDQAAQAAQIMHKIAWAEAEGETKLSVPLSWIKYIASDCFGVALRGRVTRERMDELNTADGVIEYTLHRDRQSAYTSTVTGIPIPEPTPPPSTIVGETVLAVLDISPRGDNEDDLNLLYAVSGGLPAWNGATVQRSLDGGANYTSVANINRGPVLGTLVNNLSVGSEYYTDRTNVLRVQLYRDTQTIESISDAQFLSEGGAFAVQRPDGSWEVMQYRDSAEVSAGIFDLSYLHRGQLNSGPSAHLAGALFVMLADAVKVPAQSAWIGSDMTHRAVSYGESPETASEQIETYVGRSQIEWPVAYLALARDSSDNIIGTWSPRHRFGTEDSPVESVNFRGYRVTLDDGVLPTVTFDTTTRSFTYDASALGSPLTVSVSALNRITGAGPSTSGAI